MIYTICRLALPQLFIMGCRNSWGGRVNGNKGKDLGRPTVDQLSTESSAGPL
ncbi:hypothetical protein BJX63DRAFT_379826 [Aspergillus granulosus]|uniref:Uncharacterized protein n=1 Tax=Aspergillus granulosus TaxID=176169 RepID=A0ABR4I0X9_9EURO